MDCGGEFGTAVDVVCLRRGVVWVVEVKAGWDDVGSYHRWCGRMRGAAGGLHDSPKNQHMLQLMVTRAMFCSTFGVSPCAVRAAVALVSADGVRFEALARPPPCSEAAVMRALGARCGARA
jgi:hypothetical protein